MDGLTPPTRDKPRPPAARAHRRPARKLKPGPGLTPDVVSADQRNRLRMAMIELVADRGYKRVTVRALTKEAGVSTRAFYRHFANTDDCFGCACESAMLCALHRMEEARSGAGHGEEALRAAVASLMQDVSRQPDAARVALVDASDGGPSVLARMKILTETFERLLADLLSMGLRRPAVSRQLVSGMVAGAMRVARATTMAGRADELPGLAPELSEWILALARDGATRPAVKARPGSRPRREADPFPDGRRFGDAPSIGDERERILRATVRIAADGGARRLTIPRIRVAAGVSRRSFNSYFDSLDECFLDSLEWLMRSAATRARAWAASETDGDRRVQRFLLALCAQAARKGTLATLAFVAILDPGRDGLLRRERLVTLGAAGIQQDLLPLGRVGDLALEASVAAAWHIAYIEIATGRAEHLPSLVPLFAFVFSAPLQLAEADLAEAETRDRQH